MNSKVVVLVLVLIALVVAIECTPSNTNGASCSDLCTIQLPCGETLTQCITACDALQATCTMTGHPAAFAAYASCAVDAGFSCDDSGMPVVNAPCGPQGNDLVQCQGDADFLPDAAEAVDATAADGVCVSASSCVACCQTNHPTGAKVFAAAVNACECGDAGVCSADAGPCAAETCANPPITPQANDGCDVCLTHSLNDQTDPPGACVVPVTAACNRVLDCALYVNCATQSGCSN